MINLSPISQPVFKKIDNYIFNLDEMLGQGNFSKVYRGINQITNETVAIKVIELNSLKSKKLQQLLFSQIDVLKKLHHPNILKCYEVFTSNRNCYIITQICNGGDLETKLRKNICFTQQQAQPYILDVFKGLKYLSDNNVIHRDLKIANIFLHNDIAKIADFGFAKFTKQNFQDIAIGSPIYMSPQGFINNIYGPKTDVWAFGIFIYQLLHGKTPFSHCMTQQDLRREIATPISFTSLKHDLSFDVKDVIIKCLQINQQKRIKISELQETPFIKKLLRIDTIPLGGKRHHILNVNQKTRNIKALTPSHTNQFKSALNTLGQSLQKNKLATRNFYSTFQKPLNSTNSGFSQQKTYISQNNMNIGSNFSSSNNPSPFRNVFSNNSNSNNRQKNNSMEKNMNFSNQLAKDIGSPMGLFSTNNNFNNPNININSRQQVGRKPRVQSAYITMKNSTPTIALPGIISFREAVNSLHYCRLLYKYIMTSNQLQQQDTKFTSSLATMMFKILNQISTKIQKKQISYDQSTTNKESKLRQVCGQYSRKYSIDVQKPFNRDITYETILQECKRKIQEYEATYMQKVGNSVYLILLHFLLVIVQATELLKRCATEGKFLEWSQFKYIQVFLSQNKNGFSYQTYLDKKMKVIKF